jgi:hypothetical protein
MSRKRQTPDLMVVPLWTRAKVEKAAPYLASMLRSLREALLEAKCHKRTAERLASRPGQLGRASGFALVDSLRDARRARESFREELQELHALGIHCPDPLRAEALVPFDHEQQLAWFIYDLYADEPIRHWRFHVDPPETRRPIEEIQEQAPVNSSAAGTPSSTWQLQQRDDATHRS